MSSTDSAVEVSTTEKRTEEKNDHVKKIPLKLQKRRWYILIIYSLNCVFFSAVYMIYTGVPETTQEYYKESNITMSDINSAISIGIL